MTALKSRHVYRDPRQTTAHTDKLELHEERMNYACLACNTNVEYLSWNVCTLYGYIAV